MGAACWLPLNFLIFLLPRKKVLENLPHTVRGVGMELLGTHKPVGPNLNWDPAKRDMVATRLGYVIVVSHWSTNRPILRGT